MLHLHRYKIRVAFFIGILFFTCGSSVFAQRELYQLDQDEKPYYFGISLGSSVSRFNPELHSSFMQSDSILTAEANNSNGFALGLMATARISDRFQVRFNPQLLFQERSFEYQLKYPENGLTRVTKTVESVNISFPLNVKLQSDRIGNFRVYMLGGIRADVDLASNARAKKAEDLVKINKYDWGPEGGIGFNFYFKSFILSPEVKVSHGIPNLHSRDPHLRYSRVFDKIQSKMISFTLLIEG